MEPPGRNQGAAGGPEHLLLHNRLLLQQSPPSPSNNHLKAGARGVRTHWRPFSSSNKLLTVLQPPGLCRQPPPYLLSDAPRPLPSLPPPLRHSANSTRTIPLFFTQKVVKSGNQNPSDRSSRRRRNWNSRRKEEASRRRRRWSRSSFPSR